MQLDNTPTHLNHILLFAILKIKLQYPDDIPKTCILILSNVKHFKYNVVCLIPVGFIFPQEEAEIYRHLAAVLRHCLLMSCNGEDSMEELQGSVNNLFIVQIRIYSFGMM